MKPSLPATAAPLALALLLLLAATGASAGELLVVSVSPTKNQLAVLPTTAIAVNFDRPVNPATVTVNRFWAFGRWSGTVSGSFSFSNGNQTVTLTPGTPFFAGETVMVILSHDLVAADGSPLRSGGYSFQFWIRSLPSTLQFQQIQTLDNRTFPGVATRSYGGVASDLNEDGYPDLAIVNEVSGDVRVFLNLATGTGTYGPFLNPPAPINLEGSPNEPADFNHDGHADLCVANGSANSFSRLLGNGNGTYAPQQEVTVGDSPHGIAVMDLDGDGDVDIVGTSAGNSNLWKSLNNGSGVFGAPVSFDGGIPSEWALAAADMNEDGLLDLVTGSVGSSQMAVLLATGTGTFTPQPPLFGTGSIWMIALGDFNGDGHVDATSANSSHNTGGVLFGNGLGGLTAPTFFAAGGFPISTDLGDLDGDGDLDWMTAAYSGNWRLFTNNGLGTFTFHQDFIPTQAASCAIMVDIDLDGDLDMGLVDELADEVLMQRQIGPTLAQFVRGNCNQGAGIDIADAITQLDVLFGGALQPACADACDTNDDGGLDISDPVTTLAFLFASGLIPAPQPGCGVDPTLDTLGCASFALCP